MAFHSPGATRSLSPSSRWAFAMVMCAVRPRDSRRTAPRWYAGGPRLTSPIATRSENENLPSWLLRKLEALGHRRGDGPHDLAHRVLQILACQPVGHRVGRRACDVARHASRL